MNAIFYVVCLTDRDLSLDDEGPLAGVDSIHTTSDAAGARVAEVVAANADWRCVVSVWIVQRGHRHVLSSEHLIGAGTEGFNAAWYAASDEAPPIAPPPDPPPDPVLPMTPPQESDLWP